MQVVISSLDWLLATGVLFVLLPANTPLSFLDFLGVYLLAMFAGVASNVPSGLGVFETIILLILSSKVSGAALFGSMLAPERYLLSFTNDYRGRNGCCV